MEKANSMGCNSKEQQKFRQKKQLKDKNKKQTHVQNNVTLLKVSAGENIRIHIMLNRGKKLTNLWLKIACHKSRQYRFATTVNQRLPVAQDIITTNCPAVPITTVPLIMSGGRKFPTRIHFSSVTSLYFLHVGAI